MISVGAVNQGKELYIISGGYGSCGTGSNGSKCYIPAATNSNYSITVPARTWKIIVVTNPGASVSDVNGSTRVIAVDIPNTQGVRSADWRNYRVSVDDLEAQTSYDFLSEVPTSIQSTIEAQVDNQ